MSVTYTYDTSTEGSFGTTSNYTIQSDIITISTDASGGFIYTYSTLTDVWAPYCLMEFRLRRSVSYGGTGNFELLNSTFITPNGGITWHTGIFTTPVEVYGGDEILISHTSQATFRIYTIATCANHGLAVVRFNVIKPVAPGGLYGRYYTNTILTGTPDTERVDATIDFDWSVDSLPGDLSGTTSYSIGWNGYITSAYSEEYTFTTIANGGARVYINDTLLINSWTDTGSNVTTTGTINLGEDVRYSLRVEYVNTIGTGKIQFKWSSASLAEEVVPQTVLHITDPVSGDGLLGNYINQDFVRWRFNNPQNFVMLNPTGTRVDGPINFNWTTVGPGITGIGGNSYGIKWTGFIEPSLSGNYTFYLNAAEGVRLYIDNILVIDSWIYTDSPPAAIERTSSSVSLTAATRYSVLIHYFYYISSDAVIQFSWESGDAPVAKEIVPLVNLFVASTGSTNGLTGSYYHTEKGANFGVNDVTEITAEELTASGAMSQRLDATVDFDWSGVPPGPAGIDNIYYTVEWNGWVRPLYTELYTFKVIADDGVRLFVDDVLLVDRWIFQGPTSYTGQIRLVGGRFYRIKCQYFQGAGGAVIELYWSSTSQPEQIIPTTALFDEHPINGYGLRASYWNNEIFTDPTAAVRIEDEIDMSGGSLPPAVTSPDFSARWTGYVRPNYSETYTFYATSEGAVNITIDGVLTVSNETIHTITTDSGTAILLAGRYYAIQVDYWTDGTPTSPQLMVEWESDQQERETIPFTVFFADIPPEIITTTSHFLVDGSGVYAEYYTSPAPTGTPAFTSLSDGSGTGFTFSTGTWPPGQTSFFSNVWTGYIMPYVTGSHVFTLATTGFGRFFIDADTDDGETVPSVELEFTNSGTTDPVPLCALKQHRIRVEHMCLDATPSFSLQWEGSFRTLQIIPSSTLYNALGVFGDGTNPPTGVGNGLNGRYFDNPSFIGDPVVNRTDISGVAYNFGEGSPADGVPTGVYGVRWEGNIDPPETATYTFYLVGHYGTRLYIGDLSNAIIDSIAAPGINTGTVAMSTGTYPQVVAELAAYNGGNQYAFMSWSRPGVSWALVPGVRLFAGVGTGLTGQYYNAPAPNGTISLTRFDFNFNITWPAGPGGGINSTLYSVVWTGWIRPRYSEEYTFRLYNTATHTRFFINNDLEPLIDFDLSDTGTFSGTIDLSSNVLYPVRLELIAPASISFNFTWESATETEVTVPTVVLFAVHPETDKSRGDLSGIAVGNGNGLAGRYYNNTTWSDPVALARIDQTIQFDWSTGSPDPSVNPDNFSVKWTGFILPEYSETYSFYTLSDDGIIVDVSGINLINSPSIGNFKMGTIDLSANVYYPIQVQFTEFTGSAHVALMWTSTNRKFGIVPRSRIFSSVGTGIFGQYWTLPAPTGPPVLERIDSSIDFDWTSGTPGTGVPEQFYGIIWTGYLKPVFGELYTIDVSGTGWTRVWLANTIIMDFRRVGNITILLTANDFYALRIEHSNTNNGSTVELNWQSASQTRQAIPLEALYVDVSGIDLVSNTVHGSAVPVDYTPPTGYGDGLIGKYFDTPEPGLVGDIIVQRTDSQIAFDWSTEPLPGDLSGAITFSVQWEGFLTIPQTGNYTFYVISDGAIDMSLNIISVIDRNDYDLTPSDYDASGNPLVPLSLSAGDALSVVLKYSHETGTTPAYIYLAWGISTGEPFTMIPPDMFFTIIGDGIRSRYYASRGPSLSGVADTTRIDEILTIGTLPVDVSAGEFYAVWTGWIRPNTSEDYTFYITAEGLVRLFIDGILYVDFDASGTAIAPLLDGNYHNLRVEMLSLESSPAPSVQLEWESAYHLRTTIPNVCYFVEHPFTGEDGIENGPRETAGNGLIANYWSSASPSSDTPYDISGVDAGIAFDWNNEHPGLDISGTSDLSGADFSAVWTGFLLAQFTEIHRFYVITSGRARLLIDDAEVFDVSGGSVPEDMVFYGTAGLIENNYHRIRVEFANGPGGTLPVFLRLIWWTPQNQQFATIPTSVLFTIKPRTLPGHAPGRNIRLDPSGNWVTIGEGRRTQLVEDARIACGISDVRLNIVQCPPGPSFPATGLTESVRLSQRIAACPPFRTSIATASALNLEAISTAIARARNKDITGGRTNPDSETTAARARRAAYDASGNLRYIISSGGSESQTLERRIQVASTCAVAAPLTSAARFPEFFAPIPPNPLVILSTQRGVITSQPGGLHIETCYPNTYQ